MSQSTYKQPFEAGAAKTDITPPLGSLINGDFITHYARHIHDRLYSKALVFRDNQTTLAIVVVDICVLQKKFLDGIKEEIFTLAGIPPANILISSTHTHAAGSVESLLLGAADLPYRQKLGGLIVQSVLKAKGNLRPAKITYGSVDIPEHVVCRRYFMKPGYKAYNPVTGGLDTVKTNPSGDEDQIERRASQMDTALNFLGVKGTDNRWISILGNYSMHYVGDWENGTITADYFGVFAKEIASVLQADEDFVGILSNGTSGDANIVDFIQPDRYPKLPFEKSELIGRDLARKVAGSLQRVIWESGAVLSSRYKEVVVRHRKPLPGELEAAKELVSGTIFENLKLKESHTGNEEGFKRIYAREQILLDDFPETTAFPVQALKIGSIIIGALAGEFFAETGLWLKKKIAAEKYFSISMANGCSGYVPPAHEFELGGYETWRCRSSCLELNAEMLIRQQLLELTDEL